MVVATRTMGRQARVPVEYRWLGLDRRSFGYAIAAVLVWALWAAVLPWIDRHVGWDDPIRFGDVLQVTDDVTMVPAVGWGLENGLRATDRPVSGVHAAESGVRLVQDGVQFQIRPGPWSGTPDGLLDQIVRITSTSGHGPGFQLSSDRTTIVTAQGAQGVLQGFDSPRVSGVLAAFVLGDEGIPVQVVGPPDQMAAHAEEITDMILSIRYTGGGG